MANLAQFRAQIQGGVRPNQFVVRLAPPAAYAAEFSGFEFFCHASAMPASTIGAAQAWYMGRVTPLGGERTFDPLSVVCYADPNMNLRKAFEDWSNFMNNFQDNTGETDPTQYLGSAMVYQLDRSNTGAVSAAAVPGPAIYAYKVIGIFPLQISEIQLSWQQNDVLEEFQVTFAVTEVDYNASVEM